MNGEQRKITELIGGQLFSLELCPNREINYQFLSNFQDISKFYSVAWLDEVKSRDVEAIPAVSLCKELVEKGYCNILLHVAARSLDKQLACDLLKKLQAIGIRNILVVQGDPSRIVEVEGTEFDFPYASSLIRYIRSNFGDYFCIAVAGYPEKHPNSTGLEEDLHFLKQKIQCGADFIITQATFSFSSFNKFCANCRKSSINVPILAGIFVINSFSMLDGISKFCKISASQEVFDFVKKNEENPAVIKEFGVTLAKDFIKNTLQARKTDSFITGVHFFTLNNFEGAQEVLGQLQNESATKEHREMGLK